MTLITGINPTDILFCYCKAIVYGDLTIEEIPVFDASGQITEIAQECIGPLDEFYEELRMLPESEKRFMIKPVHSDFTYINDLLSSLELNGFYKCTSDETCEVVPSFGMMETLLKVKYHVDIKLDPSYITTSEMMYQKRSHFLNRPLMARLQLAYAMLSTSPSGPQERLIELLAKVPRSPDLRAELDFLLEEIPNDPFLKLLDRVYERVPPARL